MTTVPAGLLATSIDEIDAAVDELARAADATVFDELLDGVRFERRTSLDPGPALATSDKALEAYRTHAIRALIARAPAGSKRAARLRTTVETLHAWGLVELHPQRVFIPIDCAPFAAFPKLRELSIQYAAGLRNAGALASLPLRSLTIGQSTVEDLSSLGTLADLVELRVDGLQRLDLTAFPRLARLSVIGFNSLREVVGLDRAPLRELTLASAAPIAFSAAAGVTKLDVYLCGNEAELAALPGLEELSVHYLPSLRYLEGLDRLRKLSIDARALDDWPLTLPAVEGLGLSAEIVTFAQPTFPRLTRARLRSKILTDVSALARSPGLESIDVSDCVALADLQPLAGLASLSRLDVTNTKARSESIPPALYPVVHPKTHVPRGRAIPKGPKPAAAKGAARGQAASLKKLLLSRDFASIDHGIELARSLDDPSVFAQFLEGSSVQSIEIASLFAKARNPRTALGLIPERCDRLIPNDVLGHGPAVRCYRERAFRGLLAVAPAFAELRAQVRTLFLDGRMPRHGRAPIDLAPCTAFPALETIVVHDFAALERLEALAAAPGLTTLVASRSPHKLDLRALASPTLGDLRIDEARGGVELPDAAQVPALRRLSLESSPATLALALAAQLEELHVQVPHYVNPAIQGLEGCTRLVRLRVRDHDLSAMPLARLPALREVLLENVPFDRALLDALTVSPCLERVVVDRTSWLAGDQPRHPKLVVR